jgi:hypothetical protein
MAAPTDDVCAVCLDPLAGASSAAMPGCGHPLHVTCLINCAQYDARCPVCRGLGSGVRPRADAPSAAAPPVVVLDLSAYHARRAARAAEWRRYVARRRRLAARRPDLGAGLARLRALRAEVRQAHAEACRAYDARCREVWRTDAAVRQHRDACTRLRRRERRLERSLAVELEAALGPEPASDSDGDDFVSLE